MRHVWALLASGLLVTACRWIGGPGEEDAGVDAGQPDAAMEDAGEQAECDFRRQDCPAGQRCIPVDPGDGGPPKPQCLPGACDTVAQDCPAGQKCTYAKDGGTSERRCVPVVQDGGLSEGASCQGALVSVDTCSTGLLCSAFPPVDGGMPIFECRRFCYTSADCATLQLCGLTVQLEGTDERPGLCLNAPSCEPLVPTCDVSSACYMVEARAACLPSGTLPVGATCHEANDCAPGSTCLRKLADGTGTCLSYCSLNPGESPTCASAPCQLLQGVDAGYCPP